MSSIHPTAIVAEGATLRTGVSIGPYCVIGPNVSLGDDVELVSHVSIGGHTSVGSGTKIYPFTSLGHPPQDLKYKGEPSRLEIGEYCVIREHVTMNPGTEGGGMLTKVGDRCLFMVGTHVAHDCRVGNQVILANNATLAGHVQVGDHVVIGGLAAVHQFVRIGQHAMIGGLSGVEHDVIPYGTVMGERASLAGLNLVGLKRRNFSREAIHALRGAYKLLFEESDSVLEKRVSKAREAYAAQPEVQEVLEFIHAAGNRSLCVPG
jgi:UDP-N-acetylglucosamine acyltransferase